MNMKIKLIVLLVFLIKFPIICGQETCDNVYNAIVENIMIMWTKIDTVRAINTDSAQKAIFLEDLIDSSFDVYYLARQCKELSGISIEKHEDIMNLVMSIKDSFEEVFNSVENSNFYVLRYMLQKAINTLDFF